MPSSRKLIQPIKVAGKVFWQSGKRSGKVVEFATNSVAFHMVFRDATLLVFKELNGM